jgi:hypothetical protein
MTNIASECRSTNIVRDHAMILPDDAIPGPDGIFGKDNAHLMSQGNKLQFQLSAAANTEFEDRNKGAENRHHDRDGTAGPRKSPVFLSLVEI